MDTIKLLLAATCAILLGALAWNVKKTNDQAKNPSATELTKIQRQLDDIKREEQILITEKKLREMGFASAPVEKPQDNKMAEMEAKLAAIEAQNKELETQRQDAEKKAAVSEEEAGMIATLDVESRDKQMRRSRQINQALLMASVKEIVNDPKFGTFVTINILMPENVTADSILSIRRNGVTVGQVKVRVIEGSEGVADIMPSATPFTPQVGDELIVDPF